MKYSILILTYREENPLFLEQCLKSMFTQTLPSDDIVLVCDGGLTAEMYSVIQEYKRKYPGIFRALYVDKNYGTAYASNYGIKRCRNELIVKMNSDDIAKPYRCEDYEFICRMLANGVKAVNIPEILVDYRTTPDNYNRRRNWKNTSSFLKE